MTPTFTTDPTWLKLVDEARRRIRYIARFAYWTARHRSTRNVRWVLAHEGTTWN